MNKIYDETQFAKDKILGDTSVTFVIYDDRGYQHIEVRYGGTKIKFTSGDVVWDYLLASIWTSRHIFAPMLSSTVDHFLHDQKEVIWNSTYNIFTRKTAGHQLRFVFNLIGWYSRGIRNGDWSLKKYEKKLWHIHQSKNRWPADREFRLRWYSNTVYEKLPPKPDLNVWKLPMVAVLELGTDFLLPVPIQTKGEYNLVDAKGYIVREDK